MHKTALVLGSVLLCAAACSTRDERPAAEQAPGPTPTVQRTPIGDLPEPDIDAVLAHTKTLSSDEFQGRGPGTKGEELTVAYITEQFRKLGLKPGNADGTFVQKVPLVGITPRKISDEEIVQRLVFSLVNEGARILEDGIASKASDIDMVYLMGYGFPIYRGGPMHYADRVGLFNVVQAMNRFARNPMDDAKFWQPAPLLARSPNGA